MKKGGAERRDIHSSCFSNFLIYKIPKINCPDKFKRILDLCCIFDEKPVQKKLLKVGVENSQLGPPPKKKKLKACETKQLSEIIKETEFPPNFEQLNPRMSKLGRALTSNRFFLPNELK